MTNLNDNPYLLALRRRRAAEAPPVVTEQPHTERPIENEPRVAAQPSDSFGGLLRVFRERAGISQRRLSRKAGFGPAYVYLVECGDHKPSQDAATKIAGALNLNPTDRSRLIRGSALNPAALLPRPTMAAINDAYRKAAPGIRAIMESHAAEIVRITREGLTT
jgi:transcriptional regulator with XRE-family HTH domain